MEKHTVDELWDIICKMRDNIENLDEWFDDVRRCEEWLENISKTIEELTDRVKKLEEEIGY